MQSGMSENPSKPVAAGNTEEGMQWVAGGDAVTLPPEGSERETISRSDWNLKELLERLEGDQEILRELLEIFRQDSRSNLEKARSQMAQGEYAGLSRTAHTLKGMLRSLAIAKAAKTAAALEESAGAGHGEQSRELLSRLEKELAGVLPEVEAQLAKVNS